MPKYRVWRDGVKTLMPYEDICHDLGISPQVHFVRVTTAGTISYTCGRHAEIVYLYRQCIDKHYRPAAALESLVNG